MSDLEKCLTSGDYPQRFKDIQPFIYAWEVVQRKGNQILVENDPADPGGATFAGLDHTSHPDLNFKSISAQQVNDTYLNQYWNKYDAEHYPFPLGEAFYNCCVNCGVKRANRILAAGVKNAADFIEAQENFYRRLVSARQSLAKFLKGWLNRTEALRKHLGL